MSESSSSMSIVRQSQRIVSAFLVCYCFCFCDFVSGNDRGSEKPNIVIIMADDMGWNDVGFHGSDEIPTPNIDALAYNGVILNSHYTQALCTPSRSAFLTGKYPVHLGMQHLVILEPEPWGLGLNETLMPQHLKKQGYSTHLVGKWHLGFFKKEYTPTYRGFDTHYGYWQGLQDYYDHTVHATFSAEHGYDMRRGMNVDWESEGKYTTNLLTDEAIKLIKHHNSTTGPLFLYLAHLAPHSGNDIDPLQAPDEEIAKFSYIEDPERRVYAAMVSMLDKSVGKVVTILRERRMLNNTIIVFMSDNGSKTSGVHSNHGSNYPLRGLKNSAWEGATRGVAAIWSPLIKKPQRVSNHLMHISDWLPTIYSAAGLDMKDLGAIDGKDMWKSISEDAEGPRTDLLYNIDDVFNYGAIRQGEWKYLYGTTSQGRFDQWYGSNGSAENYGYDVGEILESDTANALTAFNTYRQISELQTPFKNATKTTLLDGDKVLELRATATLVCDKDNNNESATSGVGAKCNPLESPCLFNIKDDPCERINLAQSRPVVVLNLEQSLLKIRESMVPIRNKPRDPNADPAKWNNTWTNWVDMVELQQKKSSSSLLSPMAVAIYSFVCFFFILACLAVVRRSLGASKRRDSFVFHVIEENNHHQKEVDDMNKLSKNCELSFIEHIKEDGRTID